MGYLMPQQFLWKYWRGIIHPEIRGFELTSYDVVVQGVNHSTMARQNVKILYIRRDIVLAIFWQGKAVLLYNQM